MKNCSWIPQNGFLKKSLGFEPLYFTTKLNQKNHQSEDLTTFFCTEAHLHLCAFAILHIWTCAHLHFSTFALVRACTCARLHLSMFALVHIWTCAHSNLCTSELVHIWTCAHLNLCTSETCAHLNLCTPCTCAHLTLVHTSHLCTPCTCACSVLLQACPWSSKLTHPSSLTKSLGSNIIQPFQVLACLIGAKTTKIQNDEENTETAAAAAVWIVLQASYWRPLGKFFWNSWSFFYEKTFQAWFWPWYKENNLNLKNLTK